MSNYFTYQNLANLKISLNKTKQKLADLQTKVDNLPHPAVLGDSLAKINDKFEVIKLKNQTGANALTYAGLKTLFDKYNAQFKQLTDELTAIETKLKRYDYWFELKSVNYLKIAFEKNFANYYLHNDGEFSFHYWQNPSLITTYKKPEAYAYTVLFGINQDPAITDWSPYIEYDFNANTGEVDFKLASFKKTSTEWIQKTWLAIKTSDNDTTFDFKKNPATFKILNTTYDVKTVFDKALEPHSNRDVIFSKEVLNWKRIVTDENGKKKQNPNIVESGNSIEIHGLDTIIRNTKWVGSTFRFEFVRCAGDENALWGNKYMYKVYSMIFIADKLPALDTSTWTKVYKMDSRIQWWLGNRGEIKTEHWDDCVKGAPTVQLKLEEVGGYYLRFVFEGFIRHWTGASISLKTTSYWDTFKIIADVYNK